MKKGVLITILIIAIIGVCAVWMVGRYNSMVVEDENVQTAWSQVENQYQRRTDLIPSLAKVVKAAGEREHDTYVDVMEARAKATQVTIDPSHMTQEQLENFQSIQDGLSSSLSRLLVALERYPELKTNENYQKFMDELAGTNNRITVARNTFNEQAQAYNTYIRRFPNNIIAAMFNFEKRPYFKAEAGAEKAPDFDI